MCRALCCFFFQAEDGIRDLTVTGVQTCALPISAQVLLAVMASMYAVYHGPEGLRRIAQRVHTLTVLLAAALSRLGYRIVHSSYFDTLCVEVESWALSRLIDAARARRTNLRTVSPTRIGISLDETTTLG